MEFYVKIGMLVINYMKVGTKLKRYLNKDPFLKYSLIVTGAFIITLIGYGSAKLLFRIIN